MSWATASIGDVCAVVSGATPRTEDARLWGGDILWTTPKDLSSLNTPYLDQPSRTVTEEGLRSCAATVLPPNSVLLSSRAPIGLVAINTVPMATNQGFKSLVPQPGKLDSKFLYYWLKSRTTFLQSLGNGATFKEISKAIVERIEIPLPPLDEQRRIAAILDKADALRRKRKRALELLDGLTQSIFLEMFGEPVSNPARHTTAKIGNICKVVTGNTPPRSNAALYGNAVEWIKSDNIRPPERILSVATEFLSPGGRSVARLAPPGSTLVTCIAGSPNSIGNCAMTDREVAFNQQINALLPQDLNPLFLYVQMRVGKRLVQDASTGGMKGLVSKSRLQDVKLLVPARSLQDAFAGQVIRVLDLADRLRAAIQNDTLFASLQHRAFTGKL